MKKSTEASAERWVLALTSTASGIFNMFRFLGATAGIAANAAIFIAKSRGVTAPDFSAGFVAAVFLSTALAFLAALAGLFLPARRAKQSGTNPL
jgi:hypothetical protein